MKKNRKIITSVTIDPVLKKRADELHINYSEAFEIGLKMLLSAEDEEYKRKMKIIEQENKVNRLKAQLRFGNDLSEALNEIKREYTSLLKTGENVSDNKYLQELIILKAMELDIPSKALEYLFNNMIIGKTNENEIEKYKKGDITSFMEK